MVNFRITAVLRHIYIPAISVLWFAARQFCGDEELDALVPWSGCFSDAELTICKCTTPGCNPYTLSTTTVSTNLNSWSCFVCQDCGASVGNIEDCRSTSLAGSCSLLKTPAGKGEITFKSLIC